MFTDTIYIMKILVHLDTSKVQTTVLTRLFKNRKKFLQKSQQQKLATFYRSLCQLLASFTSDLFVSKSYLLGFGRVSL